MPEPRHALSRALTAAALALLALPPAGCQRPPPAPQDDRVGVVVSIPPQAYFVQRVGGPRVAVEVLVGQGQSPHLYEPTPRQIANLAQARLYFLIGMEFEQRLLEKIYSRRGHLRVVDTRRGIELRAPDADCLHAGHQDPRAGGQQHAHENGHTHDERGLPDPHIWLSPRLVRIQAGTIADALIEIDPAHRAEYEANLAAFVQDLNELDAWITQRLAPVRGGEFLVFHPGYGYFADAYGLRQVPIEVSGKEPSARELARIVEHAKAHGARAVLLEPQYAPTAAEAVARAIGGSVLLVDPLRPDYFAMMRDLVEKVAQALGTGPGDAALRMHELSSAPGGAP